MTTLAVCEVALHLVERGRHDEARALLDEQAPDRLARGCPVCGAMPGAACFDGSVEARAFGMPWRVPRVGREIVRVNRLVPHVARVMPDQLRKEADRE